MNNAIVYSFHVRESSILDNRCYKQLKYSIHTLRKFNKDVVVYVYIAPNLASENINFGENVIVVPFENKDEEGWPDAWTELGYQQFLKHRWENAVSSIEKYNLDNVLYLDTDTVFYDDVNKLFNKYGNTNHLWAKPDNSDDLMNKVEVWPGINDGQFLLSKNISTKDILDHIKFYVNHTLSYNKDRLTKEDHLALHWVSVQYAVFDYFQNKNNPVKHFDSEEVMLHLEPNYNDTSRLILQHYYNGNFEKVVPEEFR
jgi:lipopolysaccharide biosynthesis glycosyltransferase